MITRTCALLLLAAVVAGCRSNQQTAMMENELRWVEDQYYQLEGALQAKCKELESCRLENQALRQQLSGTSNASGERVERRPTESSRPSSRRTTGGDSSPPIEPPSVEGLPDLGADMPSSVLNRQNLNADPATLAPDPAGDDVEEQTAPSTFDLPGIDALDDAQSNCDPLYDAHVTHVVLNRQLTGGYNFDGHAGDEGILIVAEPRNSAGQFVPLTGALDISLRDPQADPGQEEIAVWHLDARQAQAKLKRSLLGRGVHVELPWPDAPPKREELTLQVSYTTVDGRTLKTERDIRIDPPRELSARWTPALQEPQSLETSDVPRPQIVHEHQPIPRRLRETQPIRKTANAEPVDAGPQWSPFR